MQYRGNRSAWSGFVMTSILLKLMIFSFRINFVQRRKSQCVKESPKMCERIAEIFALYQQKLE